MYAYRVQGERGKRFVWGKIFSLEYVSRCKEDDYVVALFYSLNMYTLSDDDNYLPPSELIYV